MCCLTNLLLLLLCGSTGETWAAVVYMDLHVVNSDLSPDGFTRSYGLCAFRIPVFLNRYHRTVTAEGLFPGPLISGNKSDNFQVSE